MNTLHTHTHTPRTHMHTRTRIHTHTHTPRTHMHTRTRAHAYTHTPGPWSGGQGLFNLTTTTSIVSPASFSLSGYVSELYASVLDRQQCLLQLSLSLTSIKTTTSSARWSGTLLTLKLHNVRSIFRHLLFQTSTFLLSAPGRADGNRKGVLTRERQPKVGAWVIRNRYHSIANKREFCDSQSLNFCPTSQCWTRFWVQPLRSYVMSTKLFIECQWDQGVGHYIRCTV